MRRMKDSGIAWIGEIPTAWSTEKYKYHCRIQNGYPFDSAQFSSDSGFPLIRIRDISSGKTDTYYSGDYLDEYIVRHGDLIIGMDGDFNIRIWSSNPALLNQRCCRVLENTNTSKHFLYYTLPFILDEICALTYSTTVKHLSSFDILDAVFPVPSLPEQHRIASYLDTKCAEIDRSMELVRQSIDKLKAYRMSVITEAVTKGLGPDVSMKDSGVPWIGEIPEGWKCLSLKWVVANVKTGTTPHGAEDKYYSDDGLKWFTPSDFVQFPYLDKSVKKLSELGVQEIKVFPQNSVLLVGIGATMGKVALSSFPCSSNQQINAIQCGKELSPLFLTFYLSTITDYLFKCGKFTTMPILNQEETKNIYIPLPPHPEQHRIAAYLDTKCAEIDAVITKKQELLDKLAAYKKSLIFECVTGKREVAA